MAWHNCTYQILDFQATLSNHRRSHYTLVTLKKTDMTEICSVNFFFFFQKTAVQFSRQEIIDLGIDIGVQDKNEKTGQEKIENSRESIHQDNHNSNEDHYHLQVQNEDMEDIASLATSTSFERSSFRYSLRRRHSKRSMNV